MHSLDNQEQNYFLSSPRDDTCQLNDNTVVSTASSVAVPIASPVAGTAAESDSNAASVVLDPETTPSAPVAHSTEVKPQSNSEEALPSAVVLSVDEDLEEALDAEIIACTDDDEERDSGVDDDSDFEEEFVDRLIHKYL